MKIQNRLISHDVLLTKDCKGIQLNPYQQYSAFDLSAKHVSILENPYGPLLLFIHSNMLSFANKKQNAIGLLHNIFFIL